VIFEKWLSRTDQTKCYTRLRYKEEIVKALHSVLPADLSNRNVVFACIGTSQVRGDSLGPTVGSYLEKQGYTNILGTIQQPMHALNLESRLKEIPEGKVVIAIDAALGGLGDLRTYCVYSGSLQPGLGVGKNLPPVGHYGITGVVSMIGYYGNKGLFDTPLTTILSMASVLVQALTERFPKEPIADIQEKEEIG
jgi:putative sporulation protein YyaC